MPGLEANRRPRIVKPRSPRIICSGIYKGGQGARSDSKAADWNYDHWMFDLAVRDPGCQLIACLSRSPHFVVFSQEYFCCPCWPGPFPFVCVMLSTVFTPPMAENSGENWKMCIFCDQRGCRPVWVLENRLIPKTFWTNPLLEIGEHFSPWIKNEIHENPYKNLMPVNLKLLSILSETASESDPGTALHFTTLHQSRAFKSKG